MKTMFKPLLLMIMSASFMHSIYAMQLPTKEYFMEKVRGPISDIKLAVKNNTDKSIWVRSRNRNKNYFLISTELKPGQSASARYNLNDLITDKDQFGFSLWKANPETFKTNQAQLAANSIPFTPVISDISIPSAYITGEQMTDLPISTGFVEEQIQRFTHLWALPPEKQSAQSYTISLTISPETAASKVSEQVKAYEAQLMADIKNKVETYKAQLMKGIKGDLPLKLSIEANQ